MTRTELSEKVKSGNYDQEKLLAWVMCLPADKSAKESDETETSEKEPVIKNSRTPIKFKVGDVLMHTIFLHPFVIIGKKEKDWICVLLTTEDTYTGIIEKCNSRFFSNSYFTSTVFKVSEIKGRWINVYDNHKQLREIRKTIAKLYS